MKDTKNGEATPNRANLPKNKTTKDTGEIEGARRYSLLIIFSLLTALSIQTRIGIETLLGGFLVASVLLLILYKDILRYKPQYMRKYHMLVLLGVMIIGTMTLGRFFHYLLINLTRGLGSLPGEGAIFGIPIPAGAMLVTLLFDFHTAIFFSFTVSLLSGLWLQDSLFSIYVFVGSLVASFSVIRCKKRSDLLRGGFYVGIANIITSVILLLFNGELFTIKALSGLIFASSSILTVSAVVSIMLPLLEYFFNATTDISLLELLDMNHPLMKELMINAPGTYHHSVIVGTLVESAAEAIGVNPLLARVSAYYHDIGKIKMPEYFVENQTGAVSKHERLTPHMSSMIIASHIKEGVELAKQYKLPEPVIDIIQQHHGTSLMTYFFQKAKELNLEHTPPEEEYRYHGPKPQTRVAALVMMADAVEAASRVLSDPTPARISALVDRIINRIFLEGQLDECELTLKDIFEIKSHFSYILTGILHKRIDYPGFDFNKEATKTGYPEQRFSEVTTGSYEGIDKESYRTSRVSEEIKKRFPVSS